ncbi:MAG: hypothetical protein Kow0069_22520 [Promethearchaeota archaeon]
MSLNCDLSKVESVVREFAPEVADSWAAIEDPKEERLGRLHENRILGIKLRYLFLERPKTTTSDVEDSYEIFFQKIARSTVSTYLNQLDREGVLHKERDGRVVYYLFSHPPPDGVSPFWFVRNFCTTPAYLARAVFFANLYDQVGRDYSANGAERANKKFLLGVTVLALLYHRVKMCLLCQFGTRTVYRKMKEDLRTALSDRSDVLPKRLSSFLIKELGQIPSFGGLPLVPNKEAIKDELDELSRRYSQDLEFQLTVSLRRLELRLKRRKSQVDEA